MAIDVYLHIEGIKGESVDDAHKNWIECTSVQWDMTQPKSATASTAGGHTAERAELDDIRFQKLADLASPFSCSRARWAGHCHGPDSNSCAPTAKATASNILRWNWRTF